jgi:hypothetical protein
MTSAKIGAAEALKSLPPGGRRRATRSARIADFTAAASDAGPDGEELDHHPEWSCLQPGRRWPPTTRRRHRLDVTLAAMDMAAKRPKKDRGR